jgi:lipoprotein-anchoring transpeptidase ErfK/SrfK
MNWIDKSGQPLRPSALPREAMTLMERGQAAAKAGRKAEARYFFGQVLETVPDYPDALLWLAYLAGGGHPSLAYLARLLEADPTNQRARAAIRWARARASSPAAPSISSPQARPSNRGRYVRGAFVGLMVVMLGLVGGLATAAFVLDAPVATPTQAQPIAAVSTATLVPTNAATSTTAPSSTFSRTSTSAPTATQTQTATKPSPTATATRATASATASPPSSTPSAVPATATSLPTVDPSPTPFPTARIGDSFRWIDVDLTHQRLVAYEGETPVYTVIVSTGLPRTPTVTGRFKIYVKYRAADMSGPGYYLRQVPYVMYFFRGYGLHGTYWHNNFGQPMSHGCVNLPTPDAEWLFNWASVGTPVVVHH